MPAAKSLHIEIEMQLLATADLLNLAVNTIRQSLETSDAKDLWGVVVALEDRAAVLRELHERFSEGA